jgi:hypothetical protein
MTKRLDPAITGRLYAPVPESTPDEEWRDAVGFEGLYLVSSKGRAYGFYSHNFVRMTLTKKGYLRTNFKDHNKKNVYVSAHALTAAAFIGPCPDGEEVNHKNTIKSDNRVENLEYGTHGHNIKHAYDHGLIRTWDRGIKLDVSDVAEIRRLWSSAEKTTSKRGRVIIKRGERAKIAKRFGVAPEYVHVIVRGGAWPCLPKV